MKRTDRERVQRKAGYGDWSSSCTHKVVVSTLPYLGSASCVNTSARTNTAQCVKTQSWEAVIHTPVSTSLLTVHTVEVRAGEEEPEGRDDAQPRRMKLMDL